MAMEIDLFIVLGYFHNMQILSFNSLCYNTGLTQTTIRRNYLGHCRVCQQVSNRMKFLDIGVTKTSGVNVISFCSLSIDEDGITQMKLNEIDFCVLCPICMYQGIGKFMKLRK